MYGSYSSYLSDTLDDSIEKIKKAESGIFKKGNEQIGGLLGLYALLTS